MSDESRVIRHESFVTLHAIIADPRKNFPDWHGLEMEMEAVSVFGRTDSGRGLEEELDKKRQKRSVDPSPEAGEPAEPTD